MEASARAGRDDVDAIVESWRRERADLDLAPLEVLSRVLRLAKRLEVVRAGAFARHDLESWAFDVLSALRRSGEPYEMSPGGLMSQTLVTSGTMTNRVDRLVRAGFVERHPDPVDRRGVLVRLTPAGRTVVDAALADLLAQERDLLAPLSEAERTSVAAGLRAVLASLETDLDT